MFCRTQPTVSCSRRSRSAVMLGFVGWLGFALAACDPGGEGAGASGGGSGTTTDAPSTTDGSAGDGSAGDGSAGASVDGSTSADGSSSAGGQPFDPCAGLSRDQCTAAEDCMFVEALSARESNACDVDLFFPLELCVGVAGPLSSSSTTFYAEIDGELRYLVTGQACAIPNFFAAPLMWTECTNAPGEPEPCHCLCGTNGCPSVAAMQALEACEVEAPCGELVEHGFGDVIGDYPRCVLEALRDRSPGYYPFMMEDVLFLEQTRVYTSGGDQVQMVRRHEGDLCEGPLSGKWRPAMECTLQPPAFFDDCLQGLTDQGECLFGYTWFTDCQEVEPTCP